MARTIIFGDVHGCYDEWSQLLDTLKVSDNDQLISVGDIIFKGPYSAKCLDLAIKLPNLKCILGNHEDYFLKNFQNKNLFITKPYHNAIVEEFGKKAQQYHQFISSWPLYIEEKDYIIVHAGMRPKVPLKDQKKDDLLFLRTLGPEGTPWHDLYTDEKLVVYGHWARQGLKIKTNSIGLDTGCVYGKKLSAVILPEKRVVSVQAKKIYCPIN